MWQGTIVSNDGRMIARKEAFANASMLLAYLLAPEHYGPELRQQLWRNWNEWQGRDPQTPVETLRAEGHDEQIPWDLPQPVTVAQ